MDDQVALLLELFPQYSPDYLRQICNDGVNIDQGIQFLLSSQNPQDSQQESASTQLLPKIAAQKRSKQDIDKHNKLKGWQKFSQKLNSGQSENIIYRPCDTSSSVDQADLPRSLKGDWSSGRLQDNLEFKYRNFLKSGGGTQSDQSQIQLHWLYSVYASLQKDVVKEVYTCLDKDISQVQLVLSEMVAQQLEEQLQQDFCSTSSHNTCQLTGNTDTDLRQQAAKFSRAAHQNYKKANKQFVQGSVSVGNRLLEEASILHAEASQFNAQASKAILYQTNKGKVQNVLDLHGQYASEVCSIVGKRLDEMGSSKQRRYEHLDLIVGKGTHSINSQPVIPQVVENYLIERGALYLRKGGVLRVQLK